MKYFFIFLLSLGLSGIGFSNILLLDFNQQLAIPDINQAEAGQEEGTAALPAQIFNFNIGKIEGDLSLFGYWKIILGFGTGFLLNPELAWIVDITGFTDGLKFEQERVFSLDWYTDSGIFLHLFFNDNIDDSEFEFRYNVNQVINSLYISNKIETYPINPYRNLESGRAQDINMGLDWEHRFYKGRFDIQLDSVKLVKDSFEGKNKFVELSLLSANYQRGIYYYLPDESLGSYVEVYVSDPNGVTFSDIAESVAIDRKFTQLTEHTDFILNRQQGYIQFKDSVYPKTVLIYYTTHSSGTSLSVGDSGTNFENSGANQDYFVAHNSIDYLILAHYSQLSPFEEKNSYQITSTGSSIKQLTTEITDRYKNRLSGYQTWYDEKSGCIRIVKNSTKGNIYRKYPFYDEVDPAVFYLTSSNPKESLSQNIVACSFIQTNDQLSLTQLPITSTIVVYLNSVILSPEYYSYDFLSNSIELDIEISDYDNVLITYLAEEEDNFNLTFSLKNDFKLNEFFIIGDSIWYKMPVELWKSSYYFDMHSAELLYNVHLIGDFKKFTTNPKQGKLEFNLNSGLSLFIPDLKGLTIVEDFEYESTGCSLDLHYESWYPVDINPNVAAADYGKLYYRNLHKNQILTNDFVSIYDSIPDPDPYSSGSVIGPYSSNDGFKYGSDNKLDPTENSRSLITEIELDADEAVSIAIPVSCLVDDESEIDFTQFKGLTALVNGIDLTSPIRMYIDGGEISERYADGSSTVQTETFDEGISYLVDGSYYMYKGQGDGNNSTNDFDEDGILSSDNTGAITEFTHNSISYYQITNKDTDNLTLENFEIDQPENLATIRGIRLTFYNNNATTVTGKIIINQLRLTETNWQYDDTGTSRAEEIFPAEDDTLLDHVFSVENSDIDKKLHFQRIKERTLRVSLTQNDPFYIEKSFINPFNLKLFQYFCFFVLLEKKTDRKLKITLTDSSGNQLVQNYSLSDLSKKDWHEIRLDIKKFSGYSGSTLQINHLRIDFENESSDTEDNTIFIDEFYLDKNNPLVGFHAQSEFLYSDPDLSFDFKDFPLFAAPYINLKTTFNSANFLSNSMTPMDNHILLNESTFQYQFFTINQLVYSNLHFYNNNGTFLLYGEDLQLKWDRLPGKKNPLLFTVNYQYGKSGLSNQIVQKRKLDLESGFKLKKQLVKLSYQVINNKKDLETVENDFKFDLGLQYQELHHSSTLRMGHKNIKESDYGYFSLDNIGYLLKEDFNNFFYKGTEKSHQFTTNNYGHLLPFIFYANYFDHSFRSIYNYDNYDFKLTLAGYHKFDLIIRSRLVKKKDQKTTPLSVKYLRKLDNSYIKQQEFLNWEIAFSEYSGYLPFNIMFFCFPPFSSLYKKDGDSYFSDIGQFNLLQDELEITISWSDFISMNYFIPRTFIYKFKEKITNPVYYLIDYYFDFTLIGQGEITTHYFKKFQSEYSINQNFIIKPEQFITATQFSLELDFYFYQNMYFNSLYMYQIGRTNNQTLAEITLDHTITTRFEIYKNFFKK
ncbi:MAG: hypothetical protein MJB14_16785, partial [Spirochaetes bacterium]|nr:hypothetical protein [Spirochaetota bacterium]